MKLQVTEDNRTLSTLFLHASREMHGGKLSCQVENPMVPNSRIEDSRTLQIHCKNTKFSTNSTLTNCFGHCHRPWVCFLSLCSHYQRASEQRKCVNAKLQSIYNVNFLRKVYSLHFTTTQNDIPIYAQVPTSFLWKKILTKIKLEFFRQNNRGQICRIRCFSKLSICFPSTSAVMLRVSFGNSSRGGNSYFIRVIVGSTSLRRLQYIPLRYSRSRRQ